MPIPQNISSLKSQQGGSATPEETLKKLGGFAWWFILGLLLSLDILGGIITFLLQAVGIGGSAATLGIGAVIGIPLAVLGWTIGVFLTGNALIITLGYFAMNKVPLMQARKLAAWGVGVIIEAVPILSIFPSSSLTFLVVTLMENAKRGAGGGVLGKVGGAVLKKTVGRTPVGYVATKVAEKAL